MTPSYRKKIVTEYLNFHQGDGGGMRDQHGMNEPGMTYKTVEVGIKT